ncbi:MAG: CDP-diacylglycerol--glycerol-3-phosphate 3-phosphatidyltransferase [Pseudomonadota bacterium]
MIWTLPNLLTMLRIAAAPTVAAMVALGGPVLLFPAFLLFAVAALTDFLDGWIARRFDQQSALGQMLDPIADKVMVILVLFGLAAQESQRSWLFLLPAFAILLREIMVSGLREFLGDVKLPVTRLAKWKTTAQLSALGVLLLFSREHAAGTSSLEDGASQVVLDLLIWQRIVTADAFLNTLTLGATLGLALLWLAAALTLITGWDYFQKAMPYIRAKQETP